MKILRSWLAEFIELGELREPAALRAALIRAGIEVAAIEERGDDLVFTIEVTANRPDLLSHLGLARELAALTGRELSPRRALPETGRGGDYAIRIESERCARYSGLMLAGVRIAASPAWLAERVAALGLRPIANVVDATNYVLFELNHPLHAFDLDRLEGGIVARQARPGETLRLLDDRVITLVADDLVIADHARPVALAGVMGGAESAVGPDTVNLLLEAAWFRPDSVRRTARRHAVGTDSSYRFERGADFAATTTALRRLAGIILETAGGRIEGGIIDVVAAPRPPRAIRFRAAAARRTLGIDLERPEAPLGAIGCRIEGGTITPPSWRVDLEREIDLVEEIARLTGFDRIPETLPAFAGRTSDYHADLVPDDGRWTPEAGEKAEDFNRLRARIAAFLQGAGFDRCVAFSFDRPEGGALTLANPINAETPALRASLVPSLARIARLRFDRAGQRNARLFELDKIFDLAAGRPRERLAVAGLVTGIFEEKRYDGRPEDRVAPDHLLGLIRALGRELGADFTLTPDGGASFADAARIEVNGVAIGALGGLREREPFVPRLEEKSFVFEIDLTALHGLLRGRCLPRYRPLPRFPAATRDLAFVVDRSLAVGELLRVARAAGGAMVEEIRLFDVFALKTPAAKVSLALAVTLRAPDRTLADEEIAAAIERIVTAAGATCGAELRRS